MTDPETVAQRDAPHRCKYCGAPSWVDPSDQVSPVDVCWEGDHASCGEAGNG